MKKVLIRIIVILIVLIMAITTIFISSNNKEDNNIGNNNEVEIENEESDNKEEIENSEIDKQEIDENDMSHEHDMYHDHEETKEFENTDLTFENEPEELSKNINDVNKLKNGIRDYLASQGYISESNIPIKDYSFTNENQSIVCEVPNSILTLNVSWVNKDFSTVQYELLMP